MDIKIVITDENEETLDTITIYQDGSDSEETAKIRLWLEANFAVEFPQINNQRIRQWIESQ